MNERMEWAEALNISPENLTAWSQEVPEGTPLLVWCLETGHVSVSEYLQWAQGAANLPVLDSRFFQEHFASEILQDNAGGWHPWQFPVDKWEDVTIVACVELPREPSEAGVRYVLADPRPMRQAFEAATKGNITNVGVVPLETGMLEIPTGFGVQTKPFTLNLDYAIISPGGSPTPPMPAPVAQKPQAPSSAETGSSSAIRIDVPTPGPVETKTSAKPTKLDPATQQALIAELFTRLSIHFKASLVMRCSDTSAKLLASDDNLGLKPGSLSVSFSQPTFLRIVLKTRMPYHGYLMDNPAHREFFTSLGMSDIPKSVTAIPLKAQSGLWGVIVAIGDETHQKIESLDFALESAAPLIQLIENETAKAS